MKKKLDWLKCKRCGLVDKTRTDVIPHHIGTTTEMRCPDCAREDGRASLCRNCCPTAHGTKSDS